MKRTLLILALLCASVCRAQSSDALVDTLLARGRLKDWFSLDYILASERENLSPKKLLRLRALTDARFRRYEQSNEALETLLADAESAAPDELQEWVSQLFANYRHAMDFDSLKELYDDIRPQDVAPEDDPAYQYVEAMASVPSTRLARPAGPVEIPFRLDSAGYGRIMYVDVEIGGRCEPFIFDTGCAEMSVVSEEFAHEHGIRPLGGKATMSGGGGLAEGWFGVADSLKVGPMTLYNARFTVAPELINDSIFTMNAVLGCNFLLSVGRFEIHGREGYLRFPAVDEPRDEGAPNMFVENGLFYVRTDIDGNAAVMQFDSGNNKSFLSPEYWSKYGAQLESVTSQGKKERIAGVGGVQMLQTYTKPAVEVRVGGVVGTLYDVPIHSDETLRMAKNEDGNLGTDFLTAFDCVKVDYQTMRMTVSGPQRTYSEGTVPAGVDVGIRDVRPRTDLWRSRDGKMAANAAVRLWPARE